ncbi:MAG: tol-pal system YbgF family protein [Kiritimatiellia bacterium]
MKNIPEELIPVVEYWEQHGKMTVAAALVVIVAGVGYWAWERARVQAHMEVADALVKNYAGELPGMTARQTSASAVEELEYAIAKSGDPAIVPLLKLRLAKMQYAAGDYAAAEALYTELKASPPKGFEDVPAVGLAATLEASGKFAESQAAYEAFVAANGTSMLKLEAQIGVARCLAQTGKKDEAVKALEALIAAQDGLEAKKTEKEAALVQAQAALVPLKKQGLTSKDKEFADAEAAVAALKKEIAALTGALADKNAVTARLKSSLDVVKRWEKREAVTLASATAQVEAAVKELEKPADAAAPAAEAAEAPKAEAAAPAEKKVE